MFTAYDIDDNASIFSVDRSGVVAKLFAGAPLDRPYGIALHGGTFFIADRAAGTSENGAVFAAPVANPLPVEVALDNLVRPSAIAVSDDGATLFVGATDQITGEVGVFAAPADGGSGALLAIVDEVAAIAVAGANLVVVETRGRERDGSILVLSIGGGQPQALAFGLALDFPAGVSSSADNVTAFFTANGSVLSTPVAGGGGDPTVVDVGATFVSPGGLARARFHNAFALLDPEAPIGGAIFVLE